MKIRPVVKCRVCGVNTTAWGIGARCFRHRYAAPAKQSASDRAAAKDRAAAIAELSERYELDESMQVRTMDALARMRADRDAAGQRVG